MKRFFLLTFFAMMAYGFCFSQEESLDYFDQFGAIALETSELTEAKEDLVTVFHRRDDIVWSKVIYRIIDMRYKQNFPLYYPIQSDDPVHRSLFKVIVDAIIDGGMPIYEKLADNPRPNFATPLEKKSIPSLFLIDDPTVDYSNDENHYNIETSDAMLVHYNKKKNKLAFNFYPYEGFVRNQLKYLIQEVVFFDKHFSRLFSKIIAIAPMNSEKITSREPGQESQALMQSVLFWCSFDKLRPFLAQQYVLNSNNDTKRVTFEEFFAKRLFSSYILGEDNIDNKMIIDKTTNVQEIQKEQARIQNELLTFEQDLWEY